MVVAQGLRRAELVAAGGAVEEEGGIFGRGQFEGEVVVRDHPVEGGECHFRSRVEGFISNLPAQPTYD